jgi:peptide-methionine (R)-S-oxide reductase
MQSQRMWAAACVLGVVCAFAGLSVRSQQAKNASDGQNGAGASTAYKGKKIVKTDMEWRKILTSEQYNVLREAGTEQPFTGKYAHSTGKGVYVCAACGLELFSSKTKFDSGTGWPSFYEATPKPNVTLRTDPDGERTEVLCSRCGGHLGHVFNDGPPPTGLRYCMNSVSLDFHKETKAAPAKPKSAAKTP